MFDEEAPLGNDTVESLAHSKRRMLLPCTGDDGPMPSRSIGGAEKQKADDVCRALYGGKTSFSVKYSTCNVKLELVT